MSDTYNIAPYTKGTFESIDFSGGTFTASFDVDAKWKHILHQCAFLSASGKKVLGVLAGEPGKKILMVYSVVSDPNTEFARGNEAARDWVADMRYQISGAVFKLQWMPTFGTSKASSYTEQRWSAAYGGIYKWGPNPRATDTPSTVFATDPT